MDIFKYFFDNSTASMCILDKDFNIVESNLSFQKTFGDSCDKLTDIFTNIEVFKNLKNVLSEEKRVKETCTFKNAEQKEIKVSVKLGIIENADNDYYIFAEIVEIEPDHSAAIEKHVLYLAVINAKNPIIICDFDGKISFHNKAAYSLVANKNDPKNVSELIGSSRLKKIIDSEVNFLSEPIVVFNGKRYKFEVTFQKINYEGHGYIACLFRDITKEKDMENEIVRLEKIKSLEKVINRFTRNFNEILTTIIGYSDIALLELEEGDKFYEEFNHIEACAERAANLLNKLATFNREDVANPQMIDVVKFLLDHKDLLESIYDDDVSIDYSFKVSSARILADYTQIEQIIIGLFTNAVDSYNDVTGRKKQVSFYVDKIQREDGDFVKIAVSDNGTGIPDADIENVFDPFFTTKGDEFDKGLGLSSIYGIVKQNSGTIEINSEVGKGTTVEIYWPSADSDDRKCFIESLKGNETILFVDDDEYLRKIFKKQLSGLGYNVVEASNGEEAMEIMDKTESKIDIIITDVLMPKMNGGEFGSYMMKVSPDTPIIYASGYSEDFIEANKILVSHVNFMKKPYTVKQLAEKIRSVLD